MRRLLPLLLALVLAAPASAGTRQVVLVVSADGPIAKLDPIEIRKIFLGLPVIRFSHPLHPILNGSDEQLEQVFLQDIVAMSQSAYDRHVLGLVLRQGKPRPLELDSREAVLSALYRDRYAVSYMWSSDVAGNSRVRVLRVLWTD
ncbi:MAG TPA: hypothetical protein VE046_12215 [Steroidobacteraceae bacterium]|nr:hypothetical protein [Steroidobacteraceae bacterium]